jgi:beta-glucosidase
LSVFILIQKEIPMKKYITAIAIAAAFVACSLNGEDAENEKKMNEFVSNLMSKMTWEEKIGQLNLPVSGEIITGEARNSNLAQHIRKGEVGGFFGLKGLDRIMELQKIAVEESPHGIPLLTGMDVIHGYETTFPIPLGMAAGWDLENIEQAARIAATEASADGLCWTFSPMVDICRDPRWGRIAEGAGEDPYLGAEIAKAMVKGYQGDLKADNQIMACVKHYALYGAAEAGRDYNTVDMSRQRMFNDYFMPYREAAQAGAGSFMASFNEVDGLPATANRWLMTDVLRHRWGFKGFVVTDYTAIPEMEQHGLGDSMQVTVAALKAGIDMDMVSEYFLKNLKTALDKRLVTNEQINTACRRILEAKYKLGLFDNPYKYCDPQRARTEIFTEANRAQARRIAADCFVLLKNDNSLLPLSPNARIALVGPLANNRPNMLGTWSVSANFDKIPTLLEAFKNAVNDSTQIRYAKGSHLTEDYTLERNATMGKTFNRDEDTRSHDQLLSEAIAVARSADLIVAALGESAEMSGESSSRSNLDIPDVQKRLLQELAKTGKPVVLLLFTGRPLTIGWEHENLPAILNVWFGGTEAADAIADLVFGKVNPSGKLPVTFPKNMGQIPLYYSHKNTGRPLEDGKWFSKFRSNYLDVDNEPLYPFGFGLSYTTFTYSDIKLDATKLAEGDTLRANVTVTNTGLLDGKEVVQLYMRDMAGSVTRPVKELKGFQKISIKAGESRKVTFEITDQMLKFYNCDTDFVNEAGAFKVMIGGNSRDVKTAEFEFVKK